MLPWPGAMTQSANEAQAGAAGNKTPGSSIMGGDEEGVEAEGAKDAVKRKNPWLHGRRAVFLAVGVILTVVNVVAIVAVLKLVVPSRPHEMNNVVVDLGYTSYAGLCLENGVNQFLGMRYAAAPLGNLRWREPAAPPVTTGVQPATEFKPFCLGTGMGFPVSGQSEDCLFVNVWAPSTATPESRLPVWLFIQGGGYVSNSNANWDGAEVVQTSGNNIVYVNFDYRVGLWGFLASERVRQDGDLNVGLLDQRSLMHWVKTHISKFGGDPDHIVIHGGSAGGGSVALQLVAYGGRDDDLFVGAMMDSPFFPSQPYVSELEWQFDRLVKQTGCNVSDKTKQIACLRRQSTRKLQSSNVAQPFPGRSDPPSPLWYWTPSIDGEFLTDLPFTLYRQRKFVRVPVLSGTTTNEGSIFAANAATKKDMAIFFGNNYPKLTTLETDSIVEQYPLMPRLPHHNAWFPSTSEAYGEATFICPCMSTLDAVQSVLMSITASNLTTASNSTMATNSTDAIPSYNTTVHLDLKRAVATTTPQSARLYSYRYNVLDDMMVDAGLGVPHLFTAAAVFGPNNINGASASYYSYNAAVVPVVMRYWISFVRALDPNTHRDAGAPYWQPWQCRGLDDRRRMVLETNSSHMEIVPATQRARCDFWAGLGETMEQKKRR